jgi:hypothetical protein
MGIICVDRVIGTEEQSLDQIGFLIDSRDGKMRRGAGGGVAELVLVENGEGKKY